MRTAVLSLLAFGVASAVPAQSIISSILTIPTSQCAYRSGDDPAWAAPNLDESGWQRYSDWKPQPGQTHLWIRCHADLASLRNIAHPAVQVGLYAAYELYLNGLQIGGAGNLESGNFSMNVMRSFPVGSGQLAAGLSTIGLRITRRSLITNSSAFIPSLTPNAQIRAGDEPILDALRAQTVLAESSRFAESAICYGVIAVIAVMLLGLYFYDRSRHELLFLSIYCLCLAGLILNNFCFAGQLDYSFTTCLWLVFLFRVAGIAAQVPFFFALAKRAVPLIFWILLGACLLGYLPSLIDLAFGVHEPAWLGTLNISIVVPSVWAILIVLCITPFVAFWPYSRISPRMRILVALCMIWQFADLVFDTLAVSNSGLLIVPNLFTRWGRAAIEIRVIITECALAVLLAMLFREQRQVTQERAILAGEMRAAQGIQQALVPASLETLPGFQIAVAFRPVRDVGGDFYNCRILPGIRQRILLGDVSGKGAAAAMTAAVLIGAAQRHESESPAQLLQHLNLVMADMGFSGFATCLCTEISAAGKLTLANAGHLAPYRKG